MFPGDDLLSEHGVICRESTRIFPPIPATKRYARESMALGPFSVAAGDMLCGASFTLHRDTDFWENPTHFHPVSLANTC